MQTLVEDVQKFLDKEFPHNSLVIDALGSRSSLVRKKVKATDMRPGKTISGPAMMSLADAAVYVAILAEKIPSHAVTTQLAINFLSKPDGEKDLTAKCRLVKVGKSVIVGQVEIYSDGNDEMVALATASYSLPKA